MSENGSAVNDREADVVVIGGGIAGLSAAVTAAHAGARVTVLEANEPGGRARTSERDGFSLNIGPHALYVRGHLAGLLDAHGLTLSGGVNGGRSLGLVRAGVRHEVHMNPVGLARTATLRPRSRARLMRLFAQLPKMQAEALVGRTVANWLGDEPVDVQEFIGAFIRVSSYTHAPDQFDAGAAVRQLQLSFHGVRYLDGGWRRIVDALTARAVALDATIVPHAPVASVGVDGGRVHVTVNGEQLVARSVVVAAGGPDLATRLTGQTIAGRAALTAPIRATALDLAVARPFPDCFTLGLDRATYLSPHAPLAQLAPTGRGLVSAMRYLAPDEPVGDSSANRDELRQLARLAGITDADVLWERPLHQNVVTYGSPAAVGGGLRGRPGIDALGLPGVLLAGDWVGPEGLIGDASAASGRAAGLAAVQHCASIVA